MKKSMLILIVTALLTSCTSVTPDPDHSEENRELSTNSASFSENNTEPKSYTEAETQPSTECKISTTETIAATEIQSETVCITTAVTDMQKKKSLVNPTESQQEKADIIAENPTDYTETSTKNLEEKSDIPIQTETVKTTENIMEEVEIVVEEFAETEEIQPATEPVEISLNDYEKALSVYEYMTENGGGTCVQYAYQTYEKCLEIGLECYFAWTENQLYGHVANVVKIDGIRYVLDTQAGCFLTENMCGFTEIVDANESFVASADTISKVRY